MNPQPSARVVAAARAVLKERFGFDAFRPGQEKLIEGTLSGRDALGVLPTGGGKTLCFQLPAFLLEGLVVVASPLLSLMQDQVFRARQLGLRAASLTSQDAKESQRRTEQAIRERRLDLLFCSPERLEAVRLATLLASARTALLVVDEAHCISEWGHDFRPAFRRIGRLRAAAAGAPVLAVTATATPAVRDDIARVCRMDDPLRITTSFDRPNIRWLAVRAGAGVERVRAVARCIRRLPDIADQAVIVYAPTRRAVAAVRRALAGYGIAGDAYHAALPAEERQAVQERFMSRECNLVVATCAFGMGIDRGDVRAVFHYAFPGSLESYYQEAGRAGRDGAPSLALGFVNPLDWAIPEAFLEKSFPRPRAVLRFLAKVASMGSSAAAETRSLLGPGDAHATLLRWAGRSGALRLDPALEAWLADGEGEAPPSPSATPLAALTGRPPDLGSLQAARKQAQERLRAMQRYCHGRKCRRAVLLRYLGEEVAWRSCGSCDRCESRRS